MVLNKSQGDWRPCGDDDSLHERNSPDRYLIPHLQDFSSSLEGAHGFSKINLLRAHHLIPVELTDMHKTAITPTFGLYEYICMPFSLRNAAQMFQKLINDVIRGFPFVYA